MREGRRGLYDPAHRGQQALLRDAPRRDGQGDAAGHDRDRDHRQHGGHKRLQGQDAPAHFVLAGRQRGLHAPDQLPRELRYRRRADAQRRRPELRQSDRVELQAAGLQPGQYGRGVRHEQPVQRQRQFDLPDPGGRLPDPPACLGQQVHRGYLRCQVVRGQRRRQDFDDLQREREIRAGRDALLRQTRDAQGDAHADAAARGADEAAYLRFARGSFPHPEAAHSGRRRGTG